MTTDRGVSDAVPPVCLKNAYVSLKRHGLSFSIDNWFIYSFDEQGRLIGAYEDGPTYQRGLDNRVMMKWREPDADPPLRVRTDLSPEEKRRFFDRVRQRACAVRQACLAGEVPVVRTLRAADRDGTRLDKLLTQVTATDAGRLDADGERFRRVYRPISILPPDQYRALVVQFTEGCSYNRCTFCDFYRDRRYRVKDAAALRAHIAGIKDLFGAALELRKSIFLADGDALAVPQRRLAELLDVLHSEFAIRPSDLPDDQLPRWRAGHPTGFAGIYAFMDVFYPDRKSIADYRELARLGLRRVYIGVESGSAELLQFVNKPVTRAATRSIIDQLKSAGIAVGVIVMVGVGGDRYADRHAADTVELLNELPLARGDMIYLSDFVVHSGSEYEARAAATGVRTLSYPELLEQRRRIVAGLRYSGRGDSPRIADYDIREFIY